MPEIQIDSAGTVIQYLDSGVPVLHTPDAPYTTVVLFHGFTFNGGTFKRMLPLAKESHVRLICPHRRGYSGSTSLDASEINTPPGSDAAEFYRNFLRKRATELAQFLVQLIEIENIHPKVDTPGKAVGGISVGGWSLGGITASLLFGFGGDIDRTLKRKLEPYLKKVFFYDAIFHINGYPIPEGSFNPIYSDEISDAERNQIFAEWVSSYWTHDPNFIDAPVSELPGRYLEQRKFDNSPSSLVLNTPEELGFEVPDPSATGDLYVIDHENRAIHMEMTKRIFFAKDGEESEVFPGIDLYYLWGKKAHWDVQIAPPMVKAEMLSPPPGYHLQRKARFVAIEGSNHYGHVDQPADIFAEIARAVEFYETEEAITVKF